MNTTILFSLLISVTTNITPTIDRQRITLDNTINPPYWLGIARPYTDTTPITITQCGVFHIIYDKPGTNWELFYVTQPIQIDFYVNSLYQGSLYPATSIPEPATLGLLLTGLIFNTGFQRGRRRQHLRSFA